ncbi:MAG: hypothetical protein ACOYL5_12210 [Phototrophicaceae bacterium]
MPPTRQHLLVFPYCILLALVVTYPLITVIHSEYLGDRTTDSYEYARHIWWINYALDNGLPVIDQPYLGYPDGLDGAWIWGNPFQSFPAVVFARFMPLVLAFNLSVLVHLTLNGWAAYWLAWRLTRHLPAALLGGTIFALYPTLQGHLIAGHVGLVTLWGLPLYAVGLLALASPVSQRGRGFRGGVAPTVILTALALLASVLGNNVLLIYGVLPIAAWYGLTCLFSRNWGGLWRGIIASAIGGALALIFILPVALEQTRSNGADTRGDLNYSADLLAFAAPSFYNPLFSDLEYSRRILGEIDNIEGTAYIGVIAALLALVAVWHVPKARRWFYLALGAWVLSLGAILKINDEFAYLSFDNYWTAIPLPWALLGELPVLDIARTAGRFNYIVGLALAMLATYGWAWIITRLRGRSWFSVGYIVPLQLMLIVGIAFEYQVSWRGWMPYTPHAIDLQAIEISQLSNDPSVRAVFNIPHYHPIVAKDGLLLQTRHHKPLIAGYVTRQTPVSTAKLVLLQTTLDPALLYEAGADVVILSREWDDPEGVLEAFARQQLGEPFHDSARLLAWRVPPPTEAPAFTVIPAADERFTERARLFLYAPQDGWLTYQTALTGAQQPVTLALDGQTIQTWFVDGLQTVDERVAVTAGYHELSLHIPGGCPVSFTPALICTSVEMRGTQALDYTPSQPAPISFGNGITLQASEIRRTPNGASAVQINLAWAFDEAIPADRLVRFVHILDADGQPISQHDSGLGAFAAGDVTFDSLTVDLTDAPDDVRVYVGWYTYPEIARLPVLTPNVLGGQDGWVQLNAIAR